MLQRLNYDLTDLIFRILFSLVFLGLGLEHLFSDQLIQNLMPEWLVYKRVAGIIAGVVLLGGGCSIALGWQIERGAVVLGLFLLVVTLVVHLPALFQIPQDMPTDWGWVWNVYQRSNLAKNICLLGVCFHLINHKHGCYSLDAYLAKRREGRE